MQVWCSCFVFFHHRASDDIYLSAASTNKQTNKRHNHVWVSFGLFSLCGAVFTSWRPASRSRCHGNDKKWPPTPTPTLTPVGRLAEVILPVWVTGTSSFITVTHISARSAAAGGQRKWRRTPAFRLLPFHKSNTMGGRGGGCWPICLFACVCVCGYQGVCLRKVTAWDHLCSRATYQSDTESSFPPALSTSRLHKEHTRICFRCCNTPSSWSVACSDRFNQILTSSPTPSHLRSLAVLGPHSVLPLPSATRVCLVAGIRRPPSRKVKEELVREWHQRMRWVGSCLFSIRTS